MKKKFEEILTDCPSALSSLLPASRTFEPPIRLTSIAGISLFELRVFFHLHRHLTNKTKKIAVNSKFIHLEDFERTKNASLSIMNLGE